MKKSVYKSAMSHVRTSEDFNDATYRKLMREAKKAAPDTNMNLKERMKMEQTKKKRLAGWTIGIAACAVLAVGILALNQGGSTTSTEASAPPSSAAAAKPPISGKVAVNIEGVITEVSADGKSFKVGDLWVEITDQTRMGSNEPTSAPPSEELLQKEFKVGNTVAGYTSQDVSTGRVKADVIYNNIAPQK